MTPEMTQSVTYFVAGVVGTGCKSLLSQGQDFISKKTVVDIVVGGLVGILLPMFPIIPIPKDANLIQQAAMVAFVSYAAGHAIMSGLLTRMDSTKQLLSPTPEPPKTP